MRLVEVTLQGKPRHSDAVSCVAWVTPDELYSCGNDHQLLRWNVPSGETSKVADLPADVFPLEMHVRPRSGVQGGNAEAEIIFLITADDGKFHLVNRKGHVEKSVAAHQGAALTGRWNHDGSSFLTGGEDGLVKVWTRSGMLRFWLSKSSGFVYSTAWSPDSDAVLYTSGTALVIEPLAPNTKPIQWEAHEALVLKVAWNPNTGLIVSWGEDERYKVWDHDGRQLHISAPRYQNITALAWAADGQLFVMGSYNALILCDKNGWCHSLHRPACGSLLNLAWSNDGSQVAGAGENGHVVIARVIEKWVATPKDEDRLHNCTRIEDPTKDVDFHYLVEKRDDLCGPYNDRDLMLRYGRNIVELLRYTNTTGPIPYKTDKQSESGTRATGCKKNHLYMLPVAQRWSEYGQTGRHSFWSRDREIFNPECENWRQKQTRSDRESCRSNGNNI
ncbi:intraflagellar transport protein 80 homolog [Hyalella azteca]|uniref:Intraflagellar transport protein 80 homolog n=1 Tax=Hyalella azteca TaxID=294128 RepID=A0A8B7N0N9_HYAAZ|nr:intraflagellar transport protein 80 homolog [Hyalella azteca]